ncbi:MAG: methane monooxygenase/ammonia monooxygenase subunit B [Micromonosporaceae bacterium]
MTRIRVVARVVAAGFVLGLVAILAGPAPVAHAHGEQTQEAFLRSSTVLLYDVKYSATDVNVGDELTITGKLRVMNAWPDHTIPEPEIGFLSVIAPGPVFAVKDRRLSDMFTPQSVRIHKGQTFPFSVTLVAREEGHWHVHPSFAVEGTGTLVGRGAWIDVGPGEFHNTAALPGGEEIDLTTYGTGTVVVWHVIAFVIGVGWLVFWLRRPVLVRLGVVSAGGAGTLTDGRDVKVGLGFVALIAAVLAGGYVYSVSTAPTDPIPLQVARVAPEAEPEPERLVSSEVIRAQYRQAAETLTLTVRVDNTSGAPVTLSSLQIAEETLIREGTQAGGAHPALRIDDATLAAGEERELTVVIDAKPLVRANLLPLQEPQVRITGLLFFTDPAGNRQISEVDEVTSPILPG